MPNVTNLEVRLEDMFCTSGDQLTDSYSLKGVGGKKEILERQNTKTRDSGGCVQTHIEVLQLGFSGRLVHKLQNSSQVANVDASLSQGLGQCGSIHGQSAVVQTVFNLVITHTYL